jgi:hypothetical protein
LAEEIIKGNFKEISNVKIGFLRDHLTFDKA